MSVSNNVTDRRAARWAGQRAKRQSEFVDAAIAAIAEHGPSVSTEQIAARAGVARPQLYRHFRAAEDLHQAIAQRAAKMITAELTPQITNASGSPLHMIEQIVHTLVRWMAEHTNLLEYVTQRAVLSPDGQHDVVADIKATIAIQLSALLGAYFRVFEMDTATVDPLAFGLVGFVESATRRWLHEPGSLSQEALVGHLSKWIWGMLDHSLRAEGITLDPNQPLPPAR
ncbi:TetR/AcrR family transcriptional regulator [Kutzneria viridogrisea]